MTNLAWFNWKDGVRVLEMALWPRCPFRSLGKMDMHPYIPIHQVSAPLRVTGHFHKAIAMKILCSSDIHIGRRPNLPATISESLTSRYAWDFVVHSALTEEVGLVVLAGDIVERDNRYFEAFTPLKEGVTRLLAEGVTVAAIAGNHDSEVLPRLHASLMDELPAEAAARFILLGRKDDGQMGGWSRPVDLRIGGQGIRLLGWSFPSLHHQESPFLDVPSIASELPSLGILHGELDVRTSDYAPFTSMQLRTSPVERWVLGHIHGPSARDHEPFYCGSPVPLRSTETGAHGCWILELEGRQWSAPRLVPSPIRVEVLDVQVGKEVVSQAEILQRVHASMKDAVQRFQGENPGLKEIVFRVRLKGECGIPVPQREEGPVAIRGVNASFLGDFENGTYPDLGLEQLKEEPAVKGMLARLILNLEAEMPLEPGWDGLLEELLGLEAESLSAGAYMSLEPSMLEPRGDEAAWARERLLEVSKRLLAAARGKGGVRG